MQETIYRPDSPLRVPRAFLRTLRKDMRVVYHVGWRLFLRNLQVQARQSLLGYAWMVLPPLIAGLVWIFLGQAQVLKVTSSGVPYPVFVLTGVFLWQSFVESINSPLQQLSRARPTLAKVRVAHEAFVLAGIGVVVFNSAVRLVLLLIIMWWVGAPFYNTLVWVPFGMGALLMLGVALGWLVALFGLLYADVAVGMGLLLNLWFLVTPIVYTLPKTGLAHWLWLNPVTPLLLTSRNWLLLGTASPAPGFWLVVGGALMAFVGSWLLYRLAQPHLTARL